MNFTTADQLSGAIGLKFLVYGPAGVGKTALAATLPNPLIITAENRVQSLKTSSLEGLFGAGRPDIAYGAPVVQVETTDDIVQVYNWLIKSPDAQFFQSIVIDSLTEVAEIVLENAKPQVKDNRQAYLEVLDKTMDMLRLFRNLPKHLYCTTHADYDKDEVGVSRWSPSLPGRQLGKRIPHLFDIVAYYTFTKGPQGEDLRVLKLHPDLKHVAKEATGANLPPVVYPHLGQIISQVYNTTGA